MELIGPQSHFPSVGDHGAFALDWLRPIPYLWVTAMENMHYCKPNPITSGRLLNGCLPPEECLMVK